MIRVEGLSVAFGNFRLQDISLDVPEGTYFILLGPSGAGKTLLLETILGIKRPERGRVLLNGKNVTALPPEERHVAYVPQDLALFPHLSVRDNILFGPRIRGVPVAETQLDHLNELLEIAPLMERKDVQTLSGGEKQRVALARALIGRPRVIFMDEPFSGLDDHIRGRLQEQFHTLQRSLELTIFQVTHDQEEAFLLADRMALLMDGCIQQTGRPRDFYRSPANLRAAEFLLMKNIYRARVADGTPDRGYSIVIGGRELKLETNRPLAEGREVRVGIRPEEVVVIRPDRPLRDELKVNLLTCAVRGVINMGHRQVLRLSLDREESLCIDVMLTHHAIRDIAPQQGATVQIHLRPDAFCIFE